MSETTRAPGAVTRAGGVLTTIKRTGNDQIGLQLSVRFYEELKHLIETAGFAGTFTIMVRTKVKGTAHTKGLKISSPEIHAVRVTYHGGSNDNCIEMLLSRPGDMASFGFHARLITAQKKLLQADVGAADEKVVPLKRPADSVSPPASPQQPPTRLVPSTTPVDESITTDIQHFADDLENIQIFLLEVLPHVLANGRVLKRQCLGALHSFGYRAGGIGRIFTAIVSRGPLVIVDDNWVEIPAAWMEKLRPPAPVESPTDLLSELERLLEVSANIQQYKAH